MKTETIAFIMLLFSPFMLLAGGAAEDALEDESEQVLRIASWNIQEEMTGDYFRQLGEAFETEYGVEVEWIAYPYGDLREQVLISLSAGDAPDLVQSERGWMATFATSGYFQGVDDYLSEDYKADISDRLVADMIFEDEMYGVPWFYSPFVMYYNARLFEEAGLDPDNPPSTYEEAYEAALALSELEDGDGNEVYGLGQTTASVPVSGASLLSYIMSFGGNVWDDAGNVIISEDETVDALSFLRDMNDEGLIPEGALLRDLRSLFVEQRVGMYFDQLWGGSDAVRDDPDEEYIRVTGPLSGAGHRPTSTMEAHLMMIPENAANPELAGQFIEFATSEENLAEYLTISPFLPARTSLAHLPGQQYGFLSALEGVDESIVEIPKHERMEDIFLELTSMVQEVTAGGEDPRVAAERMADWLAREID